MLAMAGMLQLRLDIFAPAIDVSLLLAQVERLPVS